MPKAFKDHQLSVTIGTITIVLCFVFSGAYTLGQDRTSVETRLVETETEMIDHLEVSQRKWKDQEKTNEELRDSAKQTETDVGIIKNDLKWLIKEMVEKKSA